MKQFYIITNTMKDKNLVVTHEISDYLKKHGCCCYIREEQPHDSRKIPSAVQCVLVLGGDGTLLRAAREVVDQDVALLGVNLGTLGYLAELDLKSLYHGLDLLIADEYKIEQRMMLMGSVYHEDKLISNDIALNDIVMTRDGIPRAVDYNNFVNDNFLNSYHADGIIISTPTGSTGYSLSAGGPIISPDASMLLMTPLAPHTLNTRSIIFAEKDKITVEFGAGRDGRFERGVATFDGENRAHMVSRDRIEIQKARKDTRIVKISDRSFLEVLRKKMANT